MRVGRQIERWSVPSREADSVVLSNLPLTDPTVRDYRSGFLR